MFIYLCCLFYSKWEYIEEEEIADNDVSLASGANTLYDWVEFHIQIVVTMSVLNNTCFLLLL